MKDFYEQFDTHKPVIIFGLEGFSELATYVLTYDSPFKVIGYTVDSAYLNEEKKNGLPIFSFETLETHFTPDEVNLLIPLGSTNINGLRKARYDQAKARGYSFVSYVSSRTTVWSNQAIGENTMIFDESLIEAYATIGNNCIVRSDVNIFHHAKVDNHCFIAGGVIIGSRTQINQLCFLGLGSIVTNKKVLAAKTFVGAGALVTKDTEENGLYIGSPARLQTKRANEVKL